MFLLPDGNANVVSIKHIFYKTGFDPNVTVLTFVHHLMLHLCLCLCLSSALVNFCVDCLYII